MLKKMNYYFLLSLAIFLLAINLRQTRAYCPSDSKNQQPLTDQARYDFYRVYSVELTSNLHIRIFQKLEDQSDSCMIFGHARHPKQKLTVIVAAHKVADFVDLLKTYKITYRVLVSFRLLNSYQHYAYTQHRFVLQSYNFQHKINTNFWEVMPKGTDPRVFDWVHYFQLETIYAWMDMITKRYPNRVTLLDIGLSTMGIPIRGVKIGCRHNKNKAIFIESGIHAREWIAPATATFIINELLTSLDDETKRLSEKFNWIIFPVVNPDGYRYTFEGDRLWRKNRQMFGVCRGVDLNRNFPSYWNSSGTSGNPCRFDYAGPSAFSEIETRRLIKYVTDNVHREQIRAYLSFHSFSQMIMFPYSHCPDRVENYDDLKLFSAKASETIKRMSGRDYKTGSAYETIYPTSGGSKDWAYDDLHIPLAFTFELRGPPDTDYLFLLPAEEILPTAKETFAAIGTIVKEACMKGYFNNSLLI